MRLSRRHERWVYGIGGLLFLSGVGWLIAHYFLAKPDAFGNSFHPSEPWWLRLHGAAAMGFLLVLGSLFPRHLVPAWRVRRNFRSGLGVIGVMALLIATGYGLYYAAGEQSRPWISAIHWIIGLLAALIVPWHAWRGKRTRGVRPAASAPRGPRSR